MIRTSPQQLHVAADSNIPGSRVEYHIDAEVTYVLYESRLVVVRV